MGGPYRERGSKMAKTKRGKGGRMVVIFDGASGSDIPVSM